ncbi:peptidase C39 [Pedobacter frigiditerrae]|uniref:Peptidase C39 n=1 Tax=Pedobacter frigiditerrae TaxID=2530452 RepID=A0A4R0MXS0_9SPHI|nr:cysteine peptidase family C39 domain-containing protein [Pedobacter frigiditerrae]TCC91687.1 peptidase C39 [Pedobacter frigiditerrae]
MFSLLKPKKVNINTTVALLLTELNVKVCSSTLNTALEDHPEYPSLLSISECLTEWRVANEAYQINKDDYDPTDLLFPFIAHLQPNGGNYILVTEIKDHQVSYGNEKEKNATMPEADFLKVWSGVALHATPTEKSGEPNYNKNNFKDVSNKLKLPLLVTTILAAIALSINYQTINLQYSLSIAIKLAGISVSVLLLMHSIDANNPLIQNLCSLGSKNSCNAILKSDAAKVTPWLSWSEVGFFYFTGSFLSLLLVPSSLSILTWLNVLALPYTIYSISYQYRHKNWCLLCCTVQVILIEEFIINYFTNGAFNLQSSTLINVVPSVLLAFTLPILTWSMLKPILLKSVLTQPLKKQLKKFKFNSDLFKQALQNQPKYGVSNDLMPITLGNPNAETIITMVSNPFCGPCAKAHQIVDEWLSYRDDIQLKIIFSTANHDDDEKTKVSRHISALSLLNDTKLVERALNDWYKQGAKKYEAWAEKYPVEFDKEISDVTAKQKAWCDLTEITFTPTILVNGYKLPEPYRLEDIKYLLS